MRGAPSATGGGGGAVQSEAEREKQRRREQERRRREVMSGQIDMNAQNDIMTTFEEMM